VLHGGYIPSGTRLQNQETPSADCGLDDITTQVRGRIVTSGFLSLDLFVCLFVCL